MHCPRCQRENRPQATFCEECTSPLAGPTARSYADPKSEVEDLRRALSEALERERATGAILRVIASSPTTVDPVFDAILDSALRLYASPVGNLHLFDGKLFRLVAHRGMAGDFVEAWRSPQRLGPHTGPARAVAEGRPIQILDLMADRAWEEREPIRVKAVELLGARTALFVPMLKEGRPIGVIVVWRREVQAYSEAQIQLLSTFADQAVIAIENVRLFNETQEALGPEPGRPGVDVRLHPARWVCWPESKQPGRRPAATAMTCPGARLCPRGREVLRGLRHSPRARLPAVRSRDQLQEEFLPHLWDRAIRSAES